MDTREQFPARSDNEPRISLVVCTFNRARLLASALASLEAQTAPAGQYEIIVVDNNSTDDTQGVVDGAARCATNLRLVREPQQGLSHARNRGWRAARAPYVAYLDDDATMPPGWVKAALDVIDDVAPDVFGGPYHASYTEGKPRWFDDAYASLTFGNKPRVLARGEYLSGSNIVIRRDLLGRLRGFDTKLGMQGRALAYGEEPDLINRVRQALPGAVVYYDPALYIHHLVHPDKMTLRWMARYQFSVGRSMYHVFGASPGSAGRGWGWWSAASSAVVSLLTQSMDALVRRDRRRWPYIQNQLRERVLPHLCTLGRLCEQRRCAGRSRGPARMQPEPV